MSWWGEEWLRVEERCPTGHPDKPGEGEELTVSVPWVQGGGGREGKKSRLTPRFLLQRRPGRKQV